MAYIPEFTAFLNSLVGKEKIIDENGDENAPLWMMVDVFNPAPTDLREEVTTDTP
jgi:hypothetical protein